MTPQVDPSTKVCNGIPRNEAGLTVRCPFNDSPFNTCVCPCGQISPKTRFLINFWMQYGCPANYPSPTVPNPPQDNSTGQALRYRSECSHCVCCLASDLILRFHETVSANCTTPFWDPVQGRCLCTPSNCTYVDNSKPIGVRPILHCYLFSLTDRLRSQMVPILRVGYWVALFRLVEQHLRKSLHSIMLLLILHPYPKELGRLCY